MSALSDRARKINKTTPDSSKISQDRWLQLRRHIDFAVRQIEHEAMDQTEAKEYLVDIIHRALSPMDPAGPDIQTRAKIGKAEAAERRELQHYPYRRARKGKSKTGRRTTGTNSGEEGQ